MLDADVSFRTGSAGGDPDVERQRAWTSASKASDNEDDKSQVSRGGAGRAKRQREGDSDVEAASRPAPSPLERAVAAAEKRGVESAKIANETLELAKAKDKREAELVDRQKKREDEELKMKQWSQAEEWSRSANKLIRTKGEQMLETLAKADGIQIE